MKGKFNITIRKAEPNDLIQVYGLIRELAAFEKEPDEPSNPLKKFIEEGTCKQPRFQVILADDNGKVAGIALYYYGYSTWKGSMIYLDDLVVKESYRKKGIGRKLMDELIAIAREEKINQLRWHVLDWNENAINFYKKYPVTFDNTWITVKIEKENLL
ncbi:MAG: GNAT family N-acetyltransferase [Sphingobacteriales bacterium]|nr:GNAT family N-acetyltransferase [Sphingobacteriales bacterium]